MKKLLLFPLLLLSLAGLAQPGFQAALNLSRYRYAAAALADVHRKSIMAPQFGLLYKKEMNDNWFLQPELAYTQKGTRIYFDYPIGYTGPMKYVNRLNYLQLTVPAYIQLPLDDAFTFEAGVGLYIAYLLRATQKTEEFDGSSTKEPFRKGAFRKTDAGLRFSTGVRMGGQLGLHMAYELGLANIEGSSGNPAIRNRNFSITMSWVVANKK